MITNENDKEESGCFVCGSKLESGDGRYNTLRGQACILCYNAGRHVVEKAGASTLLKNENQNEVS